MTYAETCLQKIRQYYADEATNASRKERNADNIFGDVIWGCEGVDVAETEKVATSDAVYFTDGSSIDFDYRINEWVA